MHRGPRGHSREQLSATIAHNEENGGGAGWRSSAAAMNQAEVILQNHGGQYEGDGDGPQDGDPSANPNGEDRPVLTDRAEIQRVNGLLADSLRGGGGSAQAALWSKGSALHIQGKCKACHYIHSSRGCTNGEDCKFCHIPHSSSDRSKVPAMKRARSKQIADALAAHLGHDEENFRLICGLVGHRSDFLLDALADSSNTGPEAPPMSTGSRTLMSL